MLDPESAVPELVPPFAMGNIPDVEGRLSSVSHPGAPLPVVVNTAPVVAEGASRFTAPASFPYIRLFNVMEFRPVPP